MKAIPLLCIMLSMIFLLQKVKCSLESEDYNLQASYVGIIELTIRPERFSVEKKLSKKYKKKNSCK